MRADVARTGFGPAHAARRFLGRQRSQPVGIFLEPLLQALERSLAVGAERCDGVSQFLGASAQPVQRFEQAVRPLCVLEPRVLAAGERQHGRDLRIQPAQCAVDVARHLLSEQQFTRNVLRNGGELTRADAVAEELRRDVRQLVRLVDHDRVGTGKQVAEPFFLQHQVGHQQVVIDDDDVGGLRLASCREHETLLELRAFRTEAVLARRRHPRPHGILFADAGQLRDVAPLRRVRPRANPGQRGRDFLAQPARVGLLLGHVEPVTAEIVGATLQQRDAHGSADRGTDRRQVTMKQLILQCARAGGDDDLATRQQCRHEVGESLAGAGARFDHQLHAFLQRGGHVLRHLDLLRTRLVARQRAGQRPVGAQDFSQRQCHARQENVARKRSSAVEAGPSGFLSTQRTCV